MDDFLILLIRNTTIMSFIIVVYGLLTRFYFKHYVAKWRYYSWFMVVLGLIIPIRPKFNIILHESSKLTKLVQKKQISSAQVLDTFVLSEAGGGRTGSVSWSVILSVLWLMGLLVIIVYHAYKHYHFIKMVKRWGKDIEELQVIEILLDVKERLNIAENSRLLLCPCITSPMMIGFFKPIIVLPHMNYSDSELFLVLKHELIHFKRKDLWYKSLVFFATVIYWFNPIVYLMAKEISIQCEMSCDEETIQDEDFAVRKQYSGIIISTIRTQSNMNSTFITNFYDSKKNVRNRIISIMNTKKKRRGLVVTCLLAVIIMATGITITSMVPNNSNILVSEAVTTIDRRQNESEWNKKVSENQNSYGDRGNEKDKKDSGTMLNSEEIFTVGVKNEVLQIEKMTKKEFKEEARTLLRDYELFYNEDGIEIGRLLINN